VGNALIDKSFFADDISIDISRIFPVTVMSTMSSGKSTLINALFGADILPRKNQACTAKVYSILDDDTIRKTKIYVTRNDGSIDVVYENLSRELEKANNDPDVRDVLISGEINGVLNTDKALLIIDTPGPNNSQDSSHEKITKSILEKLNGGLILYVINATQMGINDDRNLLMHLNYHLRKHSNTKVLFVVNKVDQLDFEKESIVDLLAQTRSYLEDNGIKKPNIIPVSALAASLFKKALAKEKLTQNQHRDFLNCYDFFKTSDNRMVSYALTDELPNQMKKIQVRDEDFTVAELMAAIENTGITYLEKYIQKAQILSSQNTNVKINIVESEKGEDFK
jgi:GTPase Era involved in 16S rRNA processing